VLLLDSPEPGDIFEERYQLLKILGSGSMGSVFEARQLDCDRIVAVKICPPEIAINEEMKERFLREGRSLSMLCHANIVTVYHLGVTDAGTPYLVMELLKGESLRNVINKEGALTASRSIKILQQACDALDYVHSRNIVHRDLKPENMILMQSPEADFLKIIDFGLARVMFDSCGEQLQELTQTGFLLGSINYMSPEQSLGHATDNRSDIYSLTACFYEMLTGKTPYSAESPVGVLYKHVHERVPNLESEKLKVYHPCLQDVLEKGMSKKLETRYQTASEMKADLEKTQDTLSGLPLQFPASVKAAWRPRAAVIGSGIFLAALLALTIVATEMRRQTDSTKCFNQAKANVSPISPLTRLKRIKDYLDDDSLSKKESAIPAMRQNLEDLDQIMASPGMNQPLLFVASSYKCHLQELLKKPPAEREQGLKDCLKYCRTSSGQFTSEAGQILCWLGHLYLQEGKLREAGSAARTSFDLRCRSEEGDPKLPSLYIPPLLDVSEKTQPSSGVCILLEAVYEKSGNYKEALKWSDIALKRTSADASDRWTLVCNKADFLIKLARRQQAAAILQEHADLLYESGIQNYGARAMQTYTGFNTTENSIRIIGALADWASARQEFAFARRAYRQQCQLIDQTGLCRALKAGTLRKIADIPSRKRGSQ
jgi:serine/threonine protein kinase